MTLSATRLAVFLLLSVPLAAQTTGAGPGTVLYPAASGVSPGAFPKAGSGGGVSPLAALLVAGCAGAGIWLWWRGRQGASAFAGRGERRLVVSETKALGNRQYLVVAAYNDKRFLLGVCPGRIEMLTPLEAVSPPRVP